VIDKDKFKKNKLIGGFARILKYVHFTIFCLIIKVRVHYVIFYVYFGRLLAT